MRQQVGTGPETGRLVLELLGSEKPQLVRTSFFHARLHDDHGKRFDKPLVTLATTFRWTRGPQALALFMVKTVKRSLEGQGKGEPCGFMGQPEKTLYETLRKRDEVVGKAPWAIDVFGYDETGAPLITGSANAPGVLRLFEAGKLRGAELQPQVLGTQDIRIRWENEDVSGSVSRLQSLINAMDIAYFPEAAPQGSTAPKGTLGDDAPDSGKDLNSASGGVAVGADEEYATLIVERAYESYPHEERIRLLNAIGEMLRFSGKIKVIMGKGSVRLTFALTPAQAETLLQAVKAGRFAAFGVVEAQRVEDPPSSPLSATLALLRSHDIPLDDLSVEETESAVVLRGAVPSERLREMAEQTVKPTLAGREFHNNLEVVSSAEPQGQPNPQDVSRPEASVKRQKDDLSIQRQKTTATVRLFGKWHDDIKVHEAKAALANLIQEGVTQIVMDLSHCSNLSTSAMQIFFSCHRLLNEKGGKMKILAPQPDVMSLFEMLKVDEYFEIAFDEEPEALQSSEEPPTQSNESTKSP